MATQPKPPGPTEIGYIPQTDAQMRAAVQAEIESEIAGAVAPLNTQITQLGTDRDNAVTTVGQAFDVAKGAATDSAARLRTGYNEALLSEKAIIGEARDRLTQLRQTRAAEAQKLAQEIGGPVPLDEFTSPVDLESSLFDASSAGSLLKASGLAQAGVEYAESFSGRVLPLMRSREIAETRQTFDREITRIRAEIAALKAQKGGMVNERLRERQLQEREFALQRATANRDWSLAKQTAKMEAERIRLQATEIYGSDVTYDPKTGRYVPKKGGPKTLGSQSLAAQTAAEKARLKAEQEAARKVAVADRRTYAFELVEAMMTPGAETIKGGKTWMPASGPDAPGAFWNGNQWMVAVNAPDQTITRAAVTNPNQLVQALYEKGIPRKLAQEVVGKRFPNWVEGQAVGDPHKPNPKNKPPGSQNRQYTNAELGSMSASKLITIARGLGFRQTVPASIAVLGQEFTRNDKGIKARNPRYKPKEYTQKVKDFYKYWILRIYAEDLASGVPAGKQ